mgnify:CR=1 FL=1
MEKKNPFVTTVGFKKDDPDHIYVAELLNSMGRGKAQYIVKAVMLYQDMQESGEAVRVVRRSFDYDNIKSIVYQVLEERERQNKSPMSKWAMEKQKEIKLKEEDNPLSVLDKDVLDGILTSLAAFKAQ